MCPISFEVIRTRLALPLLAVAAYAQETRSRLADLLSEATTNNPEILAAQKAYEAARQRPSQESSLPNPMFSLGYSSSGSPLPFAGLGIEPTARAGVMFSQTVPYPGKRKLRGEIAQRESEAEFQRYQAVQLRVQARVKQAWFQLQRDWAQAAALERNRDLLRKFLRISEARYSVGQGAQQDIFKAQTQISILETRLIRLERDRASREAEINSLLNRPSGTSLARPEDPAPRPLALSLDELTTQARDNSPAIRRDQKMIERTQLALNLARKDYYPDYTLSAGYFNMGGMPDMYEFRVDFEIPLYFWRKQRAGVAEQAAQVQQTRRAYEATGQALGFRIKDDYLMAQTAWRLMNLYSNTVVPQATLALEASLTSYQTGGVDFLTVFTNLITIIDYELNYQDEVMAYQQALSRLEEMTGIALLDTK
jgi:outer membrane protein TolC